VFVALHWVRLSLCVAVVTLASTGCGSADGPEMYPVHGSVTYKGAPLTRGIVTYIPNDLKAGRPANGPIQADGTFSMTTQTRDDGVMRGDYKITIDSYVEEPDRPQTREEIEAQGSRAPKMRSVVPEKYTSQDLTPLKDTVDEKHSGFMKIELAD
jgi:hypothetical protein